MKHIVIAALILFAAGCKKPCYECTWWDYYGHSNNKYTIKTETFCNVAEAKEHDGKAEYVIDPTGKRVLARCTCEEK